MKKLFFAFILLILLGFSYKAQPTEGLFSAGEKSEFYKTCTVTTDCSPGNHCIQSSCMPLQCIPQKNEIRTTLSVAVLINEQYYSVTNQQIEKVIHLASENLAEKSSVGIELHGIERYKERDFNIDLYRKGTLSFQDVKNPERITHLIDNYYFEHQDHPPQAVFVFHGDVDTGAYIVSSSNLKKENYCNTFKSPELGQSYIYGASIYWTNASYSLSRTIVHELMHYFGDKQQGKAYSTKEGYPQWQQNPMYVDGDHFKHWNSSQEENCKILMGQETFEKLKNEATPGCNPLLLWNGICPYAYDIFAQSITPC